MALVFAILLWKKTNHRQKIGPHQNYVLLLNQRQIINKSENTSLYHKEKFQNHLYIFFLRQNKEFVHKNFKIKTFSK